MWLKIHQSFPQCLFHVQVTRRVTSPRGVKHLFPKTVFDSVAAGLITAILLGTALDQGVPHDPGIWSAGVSSVMRGMELAEAIGSTKCGPLTRASAAPIAGATKGRMQSANVG